MKTERITPDFLGQSVIAVPPLARRADLSLDEAANRQIIAHLEAGGVRSLMYGGNANFYNVSLAEYGHALEFLESAARPDTWVLPSFGPDYGRLMDQAKVLRHSRFPTAMALPMTFPATPAGVAQGLRRAAEALGKPVVVYIKSDNYIDPADLGALARDGMVTSVKYAVVRDDPARDDYLRRLLDHVDPRLLVSGIGERPAVVHFRDFGLGSFTSGSICVGPRGSMAMLAALKRQDWGAAEKLRAAYLPLEDLRDGISPIRVLHEAVRLAGIADTGPMLPMLSNLDAAQCARIAPVAQALRAWDASL